MESLYKLTADYEALMEYADSTDPDDEQVFLDTLDSVLGTLDVKMDDYAVVMAHMEAREELIAKEIKRLTDMKNALSSNRKRMNDKLCESMIATDRREVVTDLHKFKIVKNGGKLPLIVDGEVPDKFLKVSYEQDNEKIREALDAGEALEFAHYGERGERLKIN